MASNTTAAGSEPSFARTISTSARFAQISNCSTAAARNVSAAHTSGCRPEDLNRLASLPTVVVLPVPLTPTISVTCGRWPSAAGRETPSKIFRISSLTRSRRLSPRRARPLTAVTIRSVAATPTSAETSSSSSASMVSTSIGRVRCSGASACLTISSKRLTICCFVRLRLSRSRSNSPNSPPNEPGQLPCFRPLRPEHQLLERGARVLPAGEQLADLRRDRQLDTVAGRQGQCGVGGLDALSHHLHPGEDVLQRPPPRQLDPDMPIAAQYAGTCEPQIA